MLNDPAKQSDITFLKNHIKLLEKQIDELKKEIQKNNPDFCLTENMAINGKMIKAY
jgi:peptidoglycan hydrolase CwlO-like protein